MRKAASLGLFASLMAFVCSGAGTANPQAAVPIRVTGQPGAIALPLPPDPLPRETEPLAHMSLTDLGSNPRTFEYRDLTITANVEIVTDRAGCTYQTPPCAVPVVKVEQGGKVALLVPGASLALDSQGTAYVEGAVDIRRLDRGTSEPQVVFTLWTGGNDCCMATAIATIDSSGKWHAVTAPSQFLAQNHGGGYWFADLARDGASELIGYNGNAFDYVFGCGACSYPPTQIFRLEGLHVVDVTRAPYSRRVVLFDLSRIEAYRSESPKYVDVDGYLAGWAAEKSLLGQFNEAWPIVVAQHRVDSWLSDCRIAQSAWPPGENGSPPMCPEDQQYTPSFLQELAITLVENGYITPTEGKKVGYDVAEIKAHWAAQKAAATAAYEQEHENRSPGIPLAVGEETPEIALPLHRWWAVHPKNEFEHNSLNECTLYTDSDGNPSSPAAYVRSMWRLGNLLANSPFLAPMLKQGSKLTIKVLKRNAQGLPLVVAVSGGPLLRPDRGMFFVRGQSLCQQYAMAMNRPIEQKERQQQQQFQRLNEQLKGLGLGPEGSPSSPSPASSNATPGGNSQSPETTVLSAADLRAIGDHVRRCWTYGPGADGVQQFQVLLDVTTDADGVARIATIAPSDLDRVNSNPMLRAFAERAVNAALDPRCADLPLPPSMLGEPQHLEFRFSP